VNGGDGNDTIFWNANNALANNNNNTDGRDVIDGGDGTDTFVINGSPAAETYNIYTRAAWGATPGNNLDQLHPSTEIVITRGGTNNNVVIAELDNIEEIVINGASATPPVNTALGGDTINVFGDFTQTSLHLSTITVNGGTGDDTVDISALQSAHRILFRSNGGYDTIVGTLRPQDVIELAPGQDLSTYSLVDKGNGTKSFTNGTHSITFAGVVPPQFESPTPPATRIYQLDQEDYAALREMIQAGLVRDSSGVGNNEANPGWGSAGYQFIRLTDPHYTDGEAGIRQTSLTPRAISNIVSNQDNDGDGVEESIPNVFNGSSLLTFFGQYFDHGLDFVAKGAPGRVAIGSPSFPINAPRANIVEGTGVDGIPAQYINNASPFVDQNQAYGSHNEITDLLRKWELGANGEVRQTAYLLTGALDATGRALLPTLSHIRENHRIMTGGEEITSADIGNYKGTGQALLLDFIPVFVLLEDGSPSENFDLDAIGHNFITGDGRTNENVMLTSIHTIWARNHNFWVDKIKAETGGRWTEAEYFEAARMMNISEYQQVVFTEFATAMAGPLGDDDDGMFDIEHGFKGYDPTVDASISVEFAQAAYRFGHSMLNETIVYRDANGGLQQISLVEAFLRPDKVGELGVDVLLAGAAAVSHQAIDVDMVNALRNQLVGRPLDLAALNIFRGRDMGIAPFNSVRQQLWESTGKNSLRPYSGWDDFQARNGLSAALIAQLMAAYPDGFETMDLWIGGLAEKPVHGQLGSTFGYIFREQLDRLQHGDRFYYLEIFDDSIFADNPATFAAIIMRNTGLTGLPANVFQHDQVVHLGAQLPALGDEDDDDDTDGPIGDDDNDNGNGNGNDDDDDNDDDGGPVDDDGQDDEDEDEDEDDDDGAPVSPPTPPAPVASGEHKVGTAGADVLVGTAGNDTLVGLAGDDVILGGAGDDVILGGDGNDFLSGEDGRDVIFGGAGDDDIFGGAGNDMLYGDAGNDRIFGGDGHDLINGGAGSDTVFGGSGNDVIVAEIGDGDDVYYGGDMMLDDGFDTLDMSAITANITADLGTGLMARGHVKSAQTGNDTIWGIENIVTGSGDDVITASRAVNVMDGGAGNDTFRFLSAADAQGDTIVGFQVGDKIDLSAIDANATIAGNQSFVLVSGAFTGAAGELLVTYENRDGEQFAVVQGNTSGGANADFKISVKTTHDLTASDFHL
jgi:Ca2+-binding RTX toxin-like protein